MIKKTNPIKNDVRHVIFDVPEEYSEFYNGVGVSITKKNSVFRFNFIGEADVYCCGLYTMGDFRIRANSTIITETEKINAIRDLFVKILAISKSGKSEITFVFTLVKDQACDLVKKALADGTLFTKVKTFTNLSSGNINELYVSN